MSIDALRSKFLTTAAQRTIEVEVDGIKVGLLKPTVKQREDIVTKSKDGDAVLMAWAIVNLVVDIESGEKLFQDTDIEALLNQEVGGTIDLFTPAIVDALTQEKDPKKL